MGLERNGVRGKRRERCGCVRLWHDKHGHAIETGAMHGRLPVRPGVWADPDCPRCRGEGHVVGAEDDQDLEEAVAFATRLARTERETIGFLPAPRVRQLAGAGGLELQRENGEACGFLLTSRSRSQPHVSLILQACVCVDARRRQHALEAVDRLAARAARTGATILQAKCATDLEAQLFWAAAGFLAVDEVEGGAWRDRRLTVWRRALAEGAAIEDLARTPSVVPGRGPNGRFARIRA